MADRRRWHKARRDAIPSRAGDGHRPRRPPGFEAGCGAGPAAVFIDAFAVRGPYGGGFAHAGGFGGGFYRGGGFYHAPVYHGAWYAHPAYPAGALAAGAMLGAAAARPYYAPPVCGYYPYPPCY